MIINVLHIQLDNYVIWNVHFAAFLIEQFHEIHAYTYYTKHSTLPEGHLICREFVSSAPLIIAYSSSFGIFIDYVLVTGYTN